jgi:hypothetical protein
MPGEQRHLDQAKSNELFLQAIDQSIFPDWTITTRFYASLHYVDACLSRKSVHPLNHSARENDLRRYPDLVDLISPYVYLRNASRRSRYECRRPHQLELQESEVESKGIRKKALSLLGTPGT